MRVQDMLSLSLGASREERREKARSWHLDKVLGSSKGLCQDVIHAFFHMDGSKDGATVQRDVGRWIVK